MTERVNGDEDVSGVRGGVSSGKAAMKLPKRVQRIIERCRAGERLCFGLKQSDVGIDRYYWFEPNGRSVSMISAAAAVASGELVPLQDALLPDHTQTYTARQP